MFKGNLSIANSGAPSQIIEQVAYFQTKGIGKLKEHHHKTKFTECEISFVNNESESLDIPQEVEDEFERIAHYCIAYQMCAKIETIQPEDYDILTNPDNSGPIYVYYKEQKTDQFSTVNYTIDETKEDVELQSFVNTIVDITLAEVISQLKKKHDESIKIPDINKRFSFGSGFFKTSGNFDATDGHFSDLTTLKRTNDAVLERQGSKFAASCGFGLSTARIKYDHYKIKYGLIKVSGQMSADVNGIAINSKVSVDYNQQPCKAEIEYFRISEFGKVKIRVTGLGPLNSLASSLVTWITKKLHTDIADLIETKVTDIMQTQVENFNCEKYRSYAKFDPSPINIH
ncbi:mite allergen Lep d 7-like isoform X2 [Belonocnema kinseyi]|nr:mite allergen Lep d 7-like isoform X2 [Belonocnema kinseyi]